MTIDQTIQTITNLPIADRLLRIGAEINVRIVAFRSAKGRTFAERKATLISAPILMAEALWDSFSDVDLPPLSSSQQEELDRRMASHALNPATALSREEVEVRLRALR